MQVVGLDTDYSNLKLAYGPASTRPRLRLLPASAAPRAHVATRLEGTSRVGTAGIAVQVNGEEWIAGVRPTRISGWQRALHADYALSDSYGALLLAALSLLGVDRVDRLVTGLPVSQAMDAERREGLRTRIVGRHATGRGIVEVADVRVIAQPVGTFIDVLMHAGDDIVDVIGDGTVLVIDVGFFSVDWAVLVNGDLRRTATGTSLEAMSVLIEAAAGLVGTDCGGKPPTAAIERSLEDGERRRQGQHRCLLRGEDHRRERRVVASGLPIGQGLRGELWTANRLRAVVLSAVACHQQATVERAMGAQRAACHQLADEVHEHGCQLLRRNGIEQVTDLLRAGDLVHAEQCGGVIATALLLQAHLKIQKRGALHENHRERAQATIAHHVALVVAASACVGQVVQCLADLRHQRRRP
jgi:plasmid segregation protein ParM